MNKGYTSAHLRGKFRQRKEHISQKARQREYVPEMEDLINSNEARKEDGHEGLYNAINILKIGYQGGRAVRGEGGHWG